MSDGTPEPGISAAIAFAPVPPPISTALTTAVERSGPVELRRPRRQLVAFAFVSAAVITGLLLVMGVRADVHQLPLGWIPAVAVAWAAALMGAAWFALVPKRGSVMPRWRIASGMVAVTASAFVILGLAVHPAGSSSVIYGWGRFVRGHGCLELGLTTAALPVIAGAWFVRGSAPVGARRIAAAVGAAGGCAGGLLLHFYCRIADGPHIGLIHGGVVACAAGLAAMLVPWITGKRAPIT